MDYKYKVTTHGRAVMAACMSLEKPLRITRVAFGSGKVSEDVNLADVHELLAYVSDGAVADRRHKDDRFYLTIQFCNKAHPEVKTFLLSEFIVFTADPETGAETDLLYGTLGNYRQPVPAFNAAYPPSEFNFPLTIILLDEVNVSVAAPAALVTYQDLIEILNGIGTNILDITIQTSGWVPDTETNGEYSLHLDIASTQITEKMYPMLSVHPAFLAVAGECSLCRTIQTLDGALRLYAQTMPTAAIRASLVLLDTSYQTTGQISGSSIRVLDITVPTSGWTADEGTSGDYALHLDIANAEISEELVPDLAILPEFLSASAACGFSPSVQTMAGALRVYARTIPATQLKASLALMGVSPYTGGNGTITEEGGGAYALPIASKTQLGMVKLGDGLIGTPDGTVSVDPDKASDKDLEDMLGEVYPANHQN